MNENICSFAKGTFSLCGTVAGYLLPTVPFALICLFGIALDCYTAYSLARRVRKKHPGANDGKFKSRHYHAIFDTLLKIYAHLAASRIRQRRRRRHRPAGPPSPYARRHPQPCPQTALLEPLESRPNRKPENRRHPRRLGMGFRRLWNKNTATHPRCHDRRHRRPKNTGRDQRPRPRRPLRRTLSRAY